MFQGKVAFITGAGSGVGRAAALAFAREGARVAVVDLDSANAQETVHLVQAAGGHAVSVQADVCQAAQMESAVHTTVETFGRLDCAFNNAGVVIDEQGHLMAAVSPEERERIIAMHPIGRLAQAEEVAEAAVWLCSNRASFLCGSIVMVDGGYTVQ